MSIKKDTTPPNDETTNEQTATAIKGTQRKTPPKLDSTTTPAEKAFYYRDLIPDSGSLFSRQIPALTKDKLNDCIVVLDTNVLFLPYTGAQTDFDIYISHYTALKKLNKLLIPAQVAREYYINRSKVIHDLISDIGEGIGKLGNQKIKLHCSAFQADEALSKLHKQINAFLKLQKTISQNQKKLLKALHNWQWDDPVYAQYGNLFTPDVIVELDDIKDDTFEKNYTKIYSDFLCRCDCDKAPGFADQGKPTNNIGDYIIWLTILQIGKKHKKPLVFITNDSKKSDWSYKGSSNRTIPRQELIHEYWEASKGNPFYLCTFSELISIQGEATQEQINKIREDESQPQVAKTHHTPSRLSPYLSNDTYDFANYSFTPKRELNQGFDEKVVESIISQLQNTESQYIQRVRKLEYLRSIADSEDDRKRVNMIDHELHHLQHQLFSLQDEIIRLQNSISHL